MIRSFLTASSLVIASLAAPSLVLPGFLNSAFAAPAPKSCEGLFQPDGKADVHALDAATAEAWMNAKIAARETLTFEDALTFALVVMPEGAERRSLRQLILDEVLETETRVTNTDFLAPLRTSRYRPAGRFIFRTPRVTWVLRKISSRDEFQTEVARAVQLAAMSKIVRLYEASVYRVGPSERLRGLAEEAAQIIELKTKISAWSGFSQNYQPPAPSYVAPTARFLVTLLSGTAIERNLMSLSLLETTPELFLLAKSGALDRGAIEARLRDTYGVRAYLRWYSRHVSHVVRAVVVATVVVLAPELALTAAHQYRIEHTTSDLRTTDVNTKAALELQRLKLAELDQDLRRRAATLRSQVSVGAAEKKFAEALAAEIVDLK